GVIVGDVEDARTQRDPLGARGHEGQGGERVPRMAAGGGKLPVGRSGIRRLWRDRGEQPFPGPETGVTDRFRPLGGLGAKAPTRGGGRPPATGFSTPRAPPPP